MATPTYFKRLLLSASLVVLLAGCSSTSNHVKPADLGLNPSLIKARVVWSANVGNVDFSLEPEVIGHTVFLANASGVLISIDARTGVQTLKGNIGEKLSAGVGANADINAVVTRSNELVVSTGSTVLWRQKMGAQVFTSPMVAGGRVFVLAADRTVSAFDLQTGRRIWVLQRPGESLVLRQPGLLMAVGDTLVVGLSGQLVGINSNNGNMLWSAPVAISRGTNEIERLVDLVGPATRDATVVCSRAFQSAVACVDAANGRLLWTKPANGSVGLAGNGNYLYGSESDGKIVAWNHANGEQAWRSDRLKFRSLTTPVLLEKSIALGDDEGVVHFIAAKDGSSLAYVKTDGSAIVAGPVLAGGTLVVVTRNGGVFGIKPE